MLLLSNRGSSSIAGGTDQEPKHAETPPGAFQGVDELAEMDDWGSAWQDAKDKGEAWGGRGKGGRGVQRNTWQPKDVYVEGKKALLLTEVRLGRVRRIRVVYPLFRALLACAHRTDHLQIYHLDNLDPM